MEMESIKPGFDVQLQTGMHRGHYGRKFNKKGRTQTSKDLHGGIEKAGHSVGKDDVAENRRLENWHDARLSAIHEDKRKTYDRQREREDRWMSEFRELSPARHHKTQETGGRNSQVDGGIRSRTNDDASLGSSLSGMVMRASRLQTTDSLDDASPSWSTHATRRHSGDYRHFPGAAVISVDELPRPQRHTYLLQETEKTLDAEAASPGSSLSGTVMRASRLTTDDLKASPSWSTHATPRRSSDYRQPPGTAVISVEELPRPQRGTYLVKETERPLDAEDADRAWSGSLSQPYWLRRSSAQSNGPYAGVRPISLHGDDLMAYVHDTESTPGDFTLNAILARQQPRLQSVGSSAWNEYTADDDTGKLYRLLDNPFTAHEYERTIPVQQVSYL